MEKKASNDLKNKYDEWHSLGNWINNFKDCLYNKYSKTDCREAFDKTFNRYDALTREEIQNTYTVLRNSLSGLFDSDSDEKRKNLEKYIAAGREIFVDYYDEAKKNLPKPKPRDQKKNEDTKKYSSKPIPFDQKETEKPKYPKPLETEKERKERAAKEAAERERRRKEEERRRKEERKRNLKKKIKGYVPWVALIVVGIILFNLWGKCDSDLNNGQGKEYENIEPIVEEESGPRNQKTGMGNEKPPKKPKGPRPLSSSEREELDEILKNLRDVFAPNPHSERGESMFETCIEGGEFKFVKFVDGQLRRAESLDPKNEKVISYRRKYNSIIYK